MYAQGLSVRGYNRHFLPLLRESVSMSVAIASPPTNAFELGGWRQRRPKCGTSSEHLARVLHCTTSRIYNIRVGYPPAMTWRHVPSNLVTIHRQAGATRFPLVRGSRHSVAAVPGYGKWGEKIGIGLVSSGSCQCKSRRGTRLS
jgi:hypothetical protein